MPFRWLGVKRTASPLARRQTSYVAFEMATNVVLLGKWGLIETAFRAKISETQVLFSLPPITEFNDDSFATGFTRPK